MPRDPDEPSIISAYGLPEFTKTDASGKVAQTLARPDERYITEEYGPLVLSPGEVFNAIDTKEKGELIYVKVVTDNAYAKVLLELDDYRNDENGETCASLLYDNRTNRAEGQFYAVNGGPANGYGMIFNPQNSEPYGYKLRLQVRNDVAPTNNAYGFTLNYTSRGGLPTPITPAFIGGGIFDHPAMGGTDLDTLSKAMAKPVGAIPYQVDAVYNDAVFSNENLSLGSANPFEGLAGKPVFRRDTVALTAAVTPRGAQIVDGKTLLATEVAGTATGNVTVVFSAGTGTFPGDKDTGSTTKVTFTGGEAGDISFEVGERLFIRNGSTTYFPGIITAVDVGGKSVTVKPGLQSLPSDITVTADSESTAIGTVASHADVEPKILIKKIIIKRKRRVSFEG